MQCPIHGFVKVTGDRSRIRYGHQVLFCPREVHLARKLLCPNILVVFVGVEPQ